MLDETVVTLFLKFTVKLSLQTSKNPNNIKNKWRSVSDPPFETTEWEKKSVKSLRNNFVKFSLLSVLAVIHPPPAVAVVRCVVVRLATKEEEFCATSFFV